MRKLEGPQLEGVAKADLERVIGGMKIGSLSASDWMITSAIGSPSTSGSPGSSRGRHDGFVGMLGFLPTRDFDDGGGANPDDVGLPPAEPSPETPPEDAGGCDGGGGGMGDGTGGGNGDGGGDMGSLVCGGLDGLDGMDGLDGLDGMDGLGDLDGLDGLGGCDGGDGGMDPGADPGVDPGVDSDVDPSGGMAQADITIDPVGGGSLHYLY